MACTNQQQDRRTQVPSFSLPFGNQSNPDSSEAAYKFHPILLDASIHFVFHPDIAQPSNKDTFFLPNKLARFTFRKSPTYDGPIFSHVKLVDWTPGIFCF